MAETDADYDNNNDAAHEDDVQSLVDGQSCFPREEESFDWFCGMRNSFSLSFLVPSWSYTGEPPASQSEGERIDSATERKERNDDKVTILTRQKEAIESEKKKYVAKMREMSHLFEVGGFRMTNSRSKSSRRAEFFIMYYASKVEEQSLLLKSVCDEIKFAHFLERSKQSWTAEDSIKNRFRNLDQLLAFYDNFIKDCKQFKDVIECCRALTKYLLQMYTKPTKP
ncbi:hypothetical protein GUITHDRAFT_141497 [Guillardia theta CCMP2712]|uniref:Uncharacterized protein n=1 Tax=Guillardia theta (strain CCMP2712) TaxID=905079 RepID=L1J0G1_GUITC|nr:hypothetical protein GUITHDRAFT_141497 [Guillardia theta CCMP2712]EKX42023.1 hypothetical protein GUITHDRAFT_141497 [Guillardia theta CCMP2712]|eukprot:XP_005829003.1 hypothetical protein GUITHDRAFT_141497 [Guillardia theta CCMP2712]